LKKSNSKIYKDFNYFTFKGNEIDSILSYPFTEFSTFKNSAILRIHLTSQKSVEQKFTKRRGKYYQIHKFNFSGLNCENHFVPIIGKAHVAYISSGKVIGLSKLNRIVQYYAKRPQVQERLTNQIAAELKNILETEDVAVIIDAKHLCVSSRGIKDDTSSTVTSYFGGKFNDQEKIVELQNTLKY